MIGPYFLALGTASHIGTTHASSSLQPWSSSPLGIFLLGSTRGYQWFALILTLEVLNYLNPRPARHVHRYDFLSLEPALLVRP